MGSLYVSGLKLGAVRGYTSFETLSFYLDSKKNAAGIMKAENKMHFLADDTPCMVYCSRTKIGQLKPLHDGYDMPNAYPDAVQASMPLEDCANPLIIDFKSAAELKPLVMFVGRYADGSGYAYIAEYEEASRP